MKVFSTCVTIIKRHAGSFLLYFAVFLALQLVMSRVYIDETNFDISSVKPNFTVINRDVDSPLSVGLTEYLNRHGVAVELEDDKRALQDAAFYQATDFIIILPKGFNETFFNGGDAVIETVLTVESAKGYYADRLVNQYFNLARLYKETVEDEKALVNLVLSDLMAEAQVEMKRFGASAPINGQVHVYMRMVSYIILVLIIVSVSNITKAFRRPDVRMRNLCSPMKPRSQSFQQILCSLLVSIAAWALIILQGLLFYGSLLGDTDGRIIALMLLTSFIVTLLSLSIATLASVFITSPNAQNAAANFLALALSFLGGVFVPLEMLGDGVLKVSRLTPMYWYTVTLDNIVSLTSFSAESLSPVWQAMLIQLAFMAAFFCVALVIGKHLNQSERAFRSTKTELEA
ncbi:MAG: ABC transporter permease [Oscillospiraceae bacterium]|nr:ABC transporter permease [Oscillospiraceae bacterium]